MEVTREAAAGVTVFALMFAAIVGLAAASGNRALLAFAIPGGFWAGTAMGCLGALWAHLVGRPADVHAPLAASWGMGEMEEGADDHPSNLDERL